LTSPIRLRQESRQQLFSVVCNLYYCKTGEETKGKNDLFYHYYSYYTIARIHRCINDFLVRPYET
jgi:hypothetical protein